MKFLYFIVLPSFHSQQITSALSLVRAFEVIINKMCYNLRMAWIYIYNMRSYAVIYSSGTRTFQLYAKQHQRQWRIWAWLRKTETTSRTVPIPLALSLSLKLLPSTLHHRADAFCAHRKCVSSVPRTNASATAEPRNFAVVAIFELHVDWTGKKWWNYNVPAHEVACHECGCDIFSSAVHIYKL